MLQRNEDLQSAREYIIRDLNQKISLIKLDVSIVFDSTFRPGGSEQGHYDALEIIFTSFGETADEFIVDAIRGSPFPRKETVVTSDRQLAIHVRNLSAHAESVEDFMYRINRAYKNRSSPLKKSNERTPSLIVPSKVTSSQSTPQKNAPIELCTDYYATIFEAEWQEICSNEENIKKKKDN